MDVYLLCFMIVNPRPYYNGDKLSAFRTTINSRCFRWRGRQL